MNKFTNLHQHSMYSLLDGMSKPEDMIQKAKKLNYSALCITDHGVLFNAPEVYLACKDEGIDYIYGCELYICDDRFVKDNDNRYSHLVVLAHNEEGRINLNKIISDSYENGFYYKPRTDFGFLQAHSAGLVVLSACMAGEVSRALESGSIELAEGIVLKYKAVFGDNYYLEAQSHDIPEQHVLNRAIIDLAIKTNTKYVITTDAHYVNKDDSYIHSQFVQTAKDNDDGGIYKDCYMQGYDDVVNICSVSLSKTEIDTACETIEEIVKKCINVKLPIAEAEIPRPKLPDGFTEEIDYLRDMVYKSFYEKGIDKYPNSQEYIDRIEYELDALHKMNYDRYLLNIIEQFEDFNKLGAGRGSSSGSCVCWLSGITKVDPIKYNCVFERFIDVGQLKQLEAGEITKDKLKTPDIDSDVATSIRHDVINNLTTKYGSDRVCAIGTIGLSWAKSAIKDVARIVGIEASVANDITKTIISKELTPEVIRDEIKPEYKERYPKMFEIAERITGVARTFGVHASGKIVSDKDLTYYAPTAILNGEKTIMCDMHSVDLLMLLKSDVLGLRTLDVIYDVLEMIGKDYDYVDPNIINLNDANVYNFFQRGETDNVFQFSSDFMRSILKEMKPNNIEDLTAANAMGRPGPMQNIPHYIDRKHGREDVTYLHDDLKDILSETYGIMCYQEQVIALGRYAGLKNPDDLRVATAKKKPAMLEKVKPELINGLMKHRWTIEQIETLWSELLAYAQYSFNRSHAISYSLTAYQTMFLRCYHPLEFWAASLNSVEGKSEDITQFISSMKKDNIKLIIPSYKDISSKCYVKDGAVVIGTNIIKGMSSRIADDLFWAKKIDVRKDNFIDFLIYNEEGFGDKEHIKIGKKSLKTLIKLGYFDCSGSRAELLDLLDVFNNGKGIKYDAKHKPATKEKRAIELNNYAKEQQPIKPRASEVLMWEQECFGIPLSSFSGVPRDLGYIYNIDKNIYSEKTVYKISVYGIASGNTHMVQYSKHNSLAVGDIIRLNKVVTKSYKTGKMYKTPILYAYDLVQKSS